MNLERRELEIIWRNWCEIFTLAHLAPEWKEWIPNGPNTLATSPISEYDIDFQIAPRHKKRNQPVAGSF